MEQVQVQLMKAIVIGRHSAAVPGFEIVETRAVTFPATGRECVAVIEGLAADALEVGAALLFQNIPGQVAGALSRIFDARQNPAAEGAAIGVIVSVPGPRPGKVEMTVSTTDPSAVAEAVRFANPRASAVVDGRTVTVTVDGPPMPFQFDHIEWLN